MRIGTRASALATAQAELVAGRLRQRYPTESIEMVPITTAGDRSQASNTVGPDWGTGVFVHELEAALLDHRIDAAVHSLKDVPPIIPAELCLAATPARGDPFDVLVTSDGRSLGQIREGALIGTASARRAAFLRAARPDLRFAPIRGNVDTRLRKLRAGEYDAIVLARAGLTRLGLIVPLALLDADVLPPAPGQGALVVETRADDEPARAMAAALNDAPTAAAVAAERRAMAELEGGCRLPIAALGTPTGAESLTLLVAIAAADGSRVLRAQDSGPLAEPLSLAARVVDRLRVAGAAELIGQVAAA
ncbi:MAG: hydroxymethylbilane synthase [Chloroflexi bacterium]|nr:hydroxymethylbilane synthase [Chloroflexota bacterium]